MAVTLMSSSSSSSSSSSAAATTAGGTIFKLYTAGTLNDQKISITLEELGLEYETHKVDITKQVQKEEWYLRTNGA
ncbi:MAG: hypothetical protein M1837_000457 [Sclerophora amabilis]|nr:MAG: hypothetical protein M1837_000457 [Sclerophora amabilis]